MRVWLKVVVSHSIAGSCFHPGESQSVSCLFAGTGSAGVNKENPVLWRGNSTVLHYTHSAGTLVARPSIFVSQTHKCIAALITVHISMHTSFSQPKFWNKAFSTRSSGETKWNLICSLKIIALFCTVILVDVHFSSFVLECTAWSVVI